MKELYSFEITRQIDVEIPFVKKVAGKTVETIKKEKRDIKNRIVFVKPTKAEIEDAEFFYSQKFNEFLNSGLLSRAMLNKKMSDNGGLASKDDTQYLEKLLKANLDASQVIEFFGSAKDLSKEQVVQLEEAKAKLAITQKQLTDFETAVNSQYNHTADVKAEQRLYEFFIFNFSFYEESVGDKKQLFPMFSGDTYDEKRDFFLTISEDEEEIKEDEDLLKHKSIFEKSFERLIQVVNVWYRGYGKTQEEIDKFIAVLKGEEDKAEKPKKKKAAKQEVKKEVEEIAEDTQ